MIRRITATLALLLACASAFAQEGETKALQLSAGTAAPSLDPPFVASLLSIKADWTQSPAAKEIDADLRKAWGQDQASLKVLDKDPKAGPGLLFSSGAASIYTHEHYVSLLLWLDTRQLVVHNEVFMAPSGVDDARPPLTVSLKKDGEFFGVQPRAQSEPFFTRKREFTWSITAMSRPRNPTWHFDRELVDYEKGRGQDQPQPVNPNTYDRCSFGISPPEDGDAIIVHAFPADGDSEFLSAANRKGILALIVVEKRPSPPKVAPEAKVLLPDQVWRLKVDRSRGVRGGFGPLSQPSTPQAAVAGSQARSMISKDVIMISWSEAKDVAWGFSKSLGKWAEQKLDPPGTDSAPAVFDKLAVWRVGSSYYGFSGSAGRWDVLRLPENHTTPPVLDREFALVHDGDDVHTFAASTGRWSSPKGADSAAEGEPAESRIKVFKLRHAQAVHVERVISALFEESLDAITSDQRTNSVIATGLRPWPREDQEKLLSVIEALIIQLDQPAEGETTPAPLAASTATVTELKDRYNVQESAASALARQIRELQSAPQAHKQPIDELTASLRRAVADSFAARQQLHRAEATQLQQRVAGIQQDLQNRQKISDQIIDHRVKDLLNPDVQWETGSRVASGTSSTVSSAQSPRAASPVATPNLPAAREYRDKLLERWQSIERLYQGGKYALEDLLRSASDLAEAESAAADGQGERRAAREKHVSRLQAIKSIVDAKFEGGIEPEHSKLAVDAELLKAENLLASESAESSTSSTRPARARPNRGNSDSSQPSTAPASTFQLAAAGEPPVIRSADDFRRRLASMQGSIASMKATSLSKFAGDNETERAAARQAAIDNAERDLAFLREEYAAQLRLLELERQHAYLARQSAAQQRGVARKRFDSGQETSESVLSHEQAVQEAQHRLDRANTLLELYRKADPKNATSQPSAERDSALQKAPP